MPVCGKKNYTFFKIMVILQKAKRLIDVYNFTVEKKLQGE